MKRILLISGVLISTLLLLGGLAASQEVTTGTIEGTVTDSQGAPLPGATVVLSSAQGAKTITADALGHFRVPFLTAGVYGLTATLQGYNSVERPNIDVRLGSRVRIEVTLTKGVAEKIQVVGAAPVVDLTTTTTGATISSELMSSVPVGRNFSSTLALAPGVVASGIDDANPSIAGASGLENTYVVDGANIGNTGYGSAGSYSIVFGSLGTGVNFDYIQEIQVKTGGYEPEFGEALGGFVNLVTKTGGNQVKGSAFTYIQSDNVEATRKTTDRQNASFDPKSFDSKDYGFDVGGPLVRDKAFWYLAFDPTFTTRTRETAKATRDALGFDHKLSLERNIYNYAANVKWFAHPKHTFSLSAFGDPSIGANGPQRDEAVAVTDPTVKFSKIKFGGNNVVGRWNGELLENSFLEASVAYHRDRFEEELATNLPQGVDRRGGPVPRQYGGVGFFENAKSWNTQYKVKFSNFFQGIGEHNLRYGLDYQNIGYDHTANYSGVPGVVLPDGNVATSGYQWDINSAGTRFRINRIRTGSLTAETRTHYQSFFASDSWSPVKSVNIMAGIRYEEETLIGTLTKFNWDNNWAPRFHMTWDPTKDNKSKLSFAYGRFFGKVPNDLAVRALSSEVTYIVTYPLGNVDLTDPNNPRFTGPPDSTFLVFGNVPTVVDPKAKLTYQDEFVASIDREVRPSFSVGLSYMHRKLGRTLEDVALVPYSKLVNGTADFGEYFITNPRPELGFPKPSRKYNAVTLKGEKRIHDNWQLLGSYTWSRLKGNYEGYYRRDNGQSDPFITSLFDFPYLKDPNIFKYIIQDGLLPNDRTHVFNLFGSYAFGFNLNLGLSLKVQSGVPLTKLGFNEAYGNGGEIPLEARGASGRGPVTGDLGIHADYPIAFGPQKLHLILDVFNLLNKQKGVDFEQDFELGGTINPDPSLGLTACPTCENPDFGKPTVFQAPRQIRFAARSTF